MKYIKNSKLIGSIAIHRISLECGVIVGERDDNVLCLSTAYGVNIWVPKVAVMINPSKTATAKP